MNNRTVSVAEAKAQLSECIRDAELGRPVIIARRGKPVVAIVRAEDVEQLERLRAAGPDRGLASVAGGWDGSDDLVEAIRSAPRSPPRIPAQAERE